MKRVRVGIAVAFFTLTAALVTADLVQRKGLAWVLTALRSPASENYDPVKHAEATWGVDPTLIGSDLPNEGQSAFDDLVMGAGGNATVPYPFSTLLKKIRANLSSSGNTGGDLNGDAKGGALVSPESGLLGVLIPHGRSLQRGTPFYAPRTVVAVTAEPPTTDGSRLGLMLQNRLFVAYAEEKGLLEVISYNEKAGRFEYQMVTDYKSGQTPKVYYAPRAVCLQCHQNQATIFSQADWKETNAFSKVASGLEKAFQDHPDLPGAPSDRLTHRQIQDDLGASFTQTYYHSVPLRINDAMPYAIDQASSEANLIGTYNKVWRELCEGMVITPERCRGIYLRQILRFGLTKQLTLNGNDETQWSEAALRSWLTHWPYGIKIPNSSLPNRDPFVDVRKTDPMAGFLNGQPLPPGEISATHDPTLPIEFDPLTPRQANLVWSASSDDRSDINGTITGLSRFLAANDRKRLDQRLFDIGSAKASRTFKSPCSTVLVANGVMKFICGLPEEARASSPADAPLVAATLTMLPGAENPNALVITTNGYRELCSIDPKRSRSNPRSCKATGAGVLTTDGPNSIYTVVPSETTESLHFRLPNGNSIRQIQFIWKTADPQSSSVAVTYLDDFKFLKSAIDQLALDTGGSQVLGNQPFRRSELMIALFAKLGAPLTAYPSGNAKEASPGGVSNAAQIAVIVNSDPMLKAYNHNCGACHANTTGQPPNWLDGKNLDALKKQFIECHERIYYRLTRWDHLPAKDQIKEMPPSQYIKDPTAWENERKTLIDYLLKNSNLTAAQAAKTILMRDYDSLPRCRSEVDE